MRHTQTLGRALLAIGVIACTPLLHAATTGTPYTAIPNGQPYLDNTGTHIQAHGGFILKHDGVYYWVGEDKSHNSATFKGVAMYKSTDLENWELVGPVLSPQTRDVYGNLALAHCKIERPKLLFNAKTGKFVLWGHWETYDGYGPSRVVVATADNITGPYTVTAKGNFRPGEGNSEGVGDHVGIPTPNISKTPDANGVYPTYTPSPSYPPIATSGVTSNELKNFGYDTTLKAVAVVLDSEGYATHTRSAIARADYTMGGTGQQTLVVPRIYPAANAKVIVNSNLKDKAYIVTRTDGAQTYYTTDGTTPVPGAANTTLYVDGTPIPLDATKTVKAISVKNGASSTVARVDYQPAAAGVAAPLYPPVISVPSGSYASAIAAVKIYTVSDGTRIYFTADGRDPDPPVKGDNMGYGSRDYTLFQDPATDKAYLISAQDNVYMRVWQLTDDYTDVVPASEYPMFINLAREAPALVRKGAYIYMITSKQSGWYPNQLQYTRTLDIANKDAWEAQKLIGDNTGWHSQPTQVMNLGTEADPSLVYFGDRWNPSLLGSSTYVWLPLAIDANGAAAMSWVPELDINLASGKATGVAGQPVSIGKPVTASAAVANTSTAKRSADQANDGIAADNGNYYQAAAVPFFWQVDLQKTVDLGRIDLSFRSVGGSDSAHRYKIMGSNDGSTWTQLADNSSNTRVGFQSHNLAGQYRYVRINVSQVWDMVHNQSASWSAGILEATVYDKPADWNSTAADWGFEKPITATYVYAPTDGEWTFGGASGNGSGVTANASGFTAANPAAPQGTQVGFLQGQSNIARGLTGLVPGKTYRVTVQAAQRANKLNGQAGQTFDVLVDDAVVGSFAPPQSATTWQPYAATFTATAPFATLRFSGTNKNGGDNTIFLDQVEIQQVD